MERVSGETILGTFSCDGAVLHVTSGRIVSENARGAVSIPLASLHSFAAAGRRLLLVWGDPRTSEAFRMDGAPAAEAAVRDAVRASGRGIA